MRRRANAVYDDVLVSCCDGWAHRCGCGGPATGYGRRVAFLFRRLRAWIPAQAGIHGNLNRLTGNATFGFRCVDGQSRPAPACRLAYDSCMMEVIHSPRMRGDPPRSRKGAAQLKPLAPYARRSTPLPKGGGTIEATRPVCAGIHLCTIAVRCNPARCRHLPPPHRQEDNAVSMDSEP